MCDDDPLKSMQKTSERGSSSVCRIIWITLDSGCNSLWREKWEHLNFFLNFFQLLFKSNANDDLHRDKFKFFFIFIFSQIAFCHYVDDSKVLWLVLIFLFSIITCTSTCVCCSNLSSSPVDSREMFVNSFFFSVSSRGLGKKKLIGYIVQNKWEER